MSKYILNFTKVPKEVKKTNLLILKKNYQLGEANHLFNLLQQQIGTLEKKFSLTITNAESNAVYQFDLPLNRISSLDFLIDEDIQDELRKGNLDDNEREIFEEFGNDVSIEFENSSVLAEGTIIQKSNNEKTSVDNNKSRFSLPSLDLPDFSSVTDLGSSIMNKILKKESTEDEVEAFKSNETISETEDLVSDYIPNYEDSEDEETENIVPLEKNEQVAVANSIVESVNEVSPVMFQEQPKKVPILEDFLESFDKSIFLPIDGLIEKFETKLLQQEKGLYDYFDLTDFNDYVTRLKVNFIQVHYDPKLYKDIITGLRFQKNQFENAIYRELTALYTDVTSDTRENDKSEVLTSKTNEIATYYSKKLVDTLESLQKQFDMDKNRIETRHIEELATLKKRQEDELYQLTRHLEGDKNEKEESLNELMKNETHSVVDSLTEKHNEMVRELHMDQLTMKRNSEIQEIRSAILEVVQQALNEETAFLQDLKSKLMKEQPVFDNLFGVYKQEMNEQQELRLREREIAVEEDKLRIKTQNASDEKNKSIELEKALQQVLSGQLNKDLDNMALNQKLMGLLTQSQQQSMLGQHEMPVEKQYVTQQLNPTLSETKQNNESQSFSFGFRNKKKMMNNMTLLLVGGTMLGSALYMGNRSIRVADANTPTIQETKNSSEGTSESLPAVKTYDELITEESYIDAITKYPDRINDVVDFLYASGKSKELKVITLMAESDFGLLYSAILEEDTKAVIKEYEKLSDVHKSQISTTQVQQIATFYLLDNQVDKAKKMLN